MKPGDLVQIKAESFEAGFRDHLLGATMLVTAVDTTLPGAPDIDIAAVVQVISPDGLSRFNISDLEVVCEGR